jgi:hypothetical protein
MIGADFGAAVDSLSVAIIFAVSWLYAPPQRQTPGDR